MNTLMIPRRTTDLDTQDPLPLGQTHADDADCPFANDSLANGGTTCCSFNTELAVKALYEFGKVDLAKALRRGLDGDDAVDLARDLRRSADTLDARYIQPEDGEDGAQTGGLTNLATGVFTPWSRLAFESALTSIRQAATWYEKVGKLGFGVHVWS